MRLDEVISRWSAAWSGDTDALSLPAHEARALVGRAVEDIHDLVRLAIEVRAYGRARIAMSEAYERTNSPRHLPGWDALDRKVDELDQAVRDHRAALDRIAAIAVQLAGGDVERVTGGGA